MIWPGYQGRATIVLLLCLLCGVATFAGASDTDLLLRWPAHEGTGVHVQDNSGNGLDGLPTADWVNAAGVQALFLDGQPRSVVHVKLPVEKRIGVGSWTFMAWLRPESFSYPGQQNERRIFDYGVYPDASLNIDLNGDGALSWYFCYQPAGGAVVAAGDDSAPRLTAKSWAHLAMTVDCPHARVIAYLNGREVKQWALPAGWKGNFNQGDECTLGSGWQNYHGAVADIAVWRRALGEEEVKAIFRAQYPAYGLTLGHGLTLEDVLIECADRGNTAMARKQTTAARAAFAQILALPAVPASWAAWAELRIAQAYRQDGNRNAAQQVYQHIRDTATYLPHHRQEAEELLQEMARTARGLPARDVTASRTRLPEIAHFAAEIWVAPDGNDAQPGTQAQPVATLDHARDLVRVLRRSAAGPIAVILKNGEYPMRHPLALTAGESGREGAPVVWKASEPGKAVLYGGLRLHGFTPVRDAAVLARLAPEVRGHVQVCDVKKLGLTDYGALAVRGFLQPPSPPTLELYVDGEAQTLARWPNEGFVQVGKVITPGDVKTGAPSVFEYRDDRPARWLYAEDAWLYGYWRYRWADATLKIGKIDLATRRITSQQPYWCIGGMDDAQSIVYYAFNLLEELDRPGEWYLDRAHGLLYLWPTGDSQHQTIELGVLSTPFITATDLSYVRLEGIVCDLGRFDGITITGGTDVQLVGCTVRRMAGNGVVIANGARHLLLGCDVHHTGRAAITLSGGDRATLRRADYLIENCHLHHFGRIDHTYTPAIQVEGVGMRISHNLMHDGPSSAIRIDGNDVLVEYNDTHHAVLESDDQGGMDIFGNPSFRGIVYRYNRFENIGNGTTMTAGQSAIRFDDVISGMLVYSNLFIHSSNGNFGAIQINSGRDNILDNNVFINCNMGISGGWYAANPYWEQAKKGADPECYHSALYLQRYPEMAHLFDGNGRNFAWRLAFIDCGMPIVQRDNFDTLALGAWTAKDAGFADAARGKWTLNAESDLVLRLGLRPIPLDEIGLYPDRTRASWPVMTPATVSK